MLPIFTIFIGQIYNLKIRVGMKGFLKNKSAGSQFLIVLCIVLVSTFLFSLIGTFILAAISGMSLKEIADMSKWDYSKPVVLFMVRGMMLVQFIGVFVIPSLLAAWMFSTNKKKYLGLIAPANLNYFIAAVGIMLVALPLVNWLGEVNRQVQFPAALEKWLKEKEVDAQQTIKGILGQGGIKNLLLNLVFIAGFAAVGEELLFRGVLQRILIKMFKSPWAGIIVTAIFFSALHMQFYGFLPRFFLGVLLGVIYWYSGSLWAAILAHFVYDAVLIVAAYYNPELMNEDAMATKTANLALAGVISAALVAAVIWWMKQKSATRYNEVYADDAIPYKNHPFDFEQNLPA
jgi:uncharacterized protein